MAADWLQKLVDDGVISADQLTEAEQIASSMGIKVEEALVKNGYTTDAVIAECQANAFGHEFVDLTETEIPPSVVEMVPESVARENTVVPLGLAGESLVIAISDPLALDVMDKLRFILNREIDIKVSSKEQIQTAINRHYGQSETESVDSMLQEFTETAIDFTQTESSEGITVEEDESSPVVRLINLVISEAVAMRASDIHIEPFEDRVRIRYRIDGVLVERDSPPRRLLGALISRVKIMASIDISEKRRPQDGRIKTRAGGADYDLRISILPTNHGQAIVMRILDRENIKVGIRNLGFSEDNYRTFQNIIRRPNGIFLVTGPTGSGKTTTLYSALGELNRPDRKIITAEDPVEYYLPGINQVEVKSSIGMTFSRIIRSMLRQAPNVILVGEIRDMETADMAIQASLTGHLVFSTLHTNDAPGSITRLIDMGVQPFLVASSVMAVMAQRLVRVVCTKCKESYKPDPGELKQLEITSEEIANADFVRGRGCNNCQHTGFRGRKAVFELMTMNSTLRDMTFRREPTQNLRRQARLAGMATLVDDAKLKAIEGITSLSEVVKLGMGGH
ncbi:MAG: type II/IV secretion system protein [Planctomycetaceae bacterium]|jgi:type IV pilus assembly protein PilB|nr:type II/IV secretion system protein [Planctomycetaceae bacterium]MBT6155781.1 type II/IV secretion system protein [Planctomycetaceae bacterium]MBT6483523.1 type II/IV secretion system protein [Planctomycetaceae bacterium]MBT6493152.1 type II/IV secretion system protein [Planctomycetaceae bacterium]